MPHRFGSDTEGLKTPSETYQIIVGADNLVDTSPLEIGFDEVTSFAFNEALSTGTGADCQMTLIGDPQIGPFGIGGAMEQIVQVIEITQTADTRCVWDYVERLAITSSRISGSSTRSFIYAGTGAQSIPIPSDIQPQDLSKSMSAVEDSEISWTISKAATPTNFGFGNTCNDDVPNTKDVQVTISLTKGEASSGALTATTTVTAINPSSRTVYYDCTDEVFSGDALVDEEDLDFSVLAGATATPTITHTLPSGIRNLRDELTCTIQVEDILNPGDMLIVGTVTAEFSLPNEQIADGEVVNETVVVHDEESITAGEDRYDFSTTDPSGAAGTFDGYVVGTLTDGPVLWASESQNDSAEIVFTKTVRVERGYDVNGTLADTASINLAEGITSEANASTTFTTDPKIDLTIDKELVYNGGPFPVANDTEWTFEVKDSSDAVVGNVTITIPAGSTSGSVTIDDLDPGTYTVEETGVVDQWVPASNPQNVTLALPSCGESVTFTNNPADNFFAEIQVKKMTDPPGKEAGWTFDLTGTDDGETAQVITTDANFIRFDLDGGNNEGADVGSYSITEQLPPSGWDLQGTSLSIVGCIDETQNTAAPIVGTNSCNFDVEYERHAGCVFQCTFENIERGTIIVEKQTEPDGSDQSFTFNGDASGNLLDNQQIVVENLMSGTYTSTEVVPPTWDLTSIVCDDEASEHPSSVDIDTATATFELDPGETVTCTFTNRERGRAKVTKYVGGIGQAPYGDESFDFEIRQGASASAAGDVIATATADASNYLDVPFVCAADATDPPCRNDINGEALLVPGDYQLCERGLTVNWTTSLADEPGYFAPGPAPADNSTYCIPFTLDAGGEFAITVNNTPPPDGDARTIGFWKNWTSCDGHGNQHDVLGDYLYPATQCVDGASGILIGDVCIDTCEDAVSILDKRSFDGQKLASDACYNAASQLLAAQLNNLADAGCPALIGLISETQAALIDAGFTGEDPCFAKGKGKKDHATQIELLN